MTIDLRLIIGVLVLGVFIAGLFLCLSGDPEADKIDRGPTSDNEAANILSGAAELLDSRTPSGQTPQNLPLKKAEASEIANPINPYVPRVTSTKITLPEYSRLDSVAIADTTDDDPSTIQSDAAQVGDEFYDRPYSRRVGLITGGDKVEAQSSGVSTDMTSFYSDIQSWSRSDRTAAEGRTKAYNIRQEAEALRSQASNLPTEERDALLQKAAEMENYSNRISATRGSPTKLKALKRDTDSKLGN